MEDNDRRPLDLDYIRQQLEESRGLGVRTGIKAGIMLMYGIKPIDPAGPLPPEPGTQP